MPSAGPGRTGSNHRSAPWWSRTSAAPAVVGRRRGRAFAVRRLHPSARRRRCAGAHADCVEPAAVRSGAGFRADRAPGHDRARDRGSSRAAGEDARRIDRLRQEQSRQALLRVGRRRLDEPARGRTVQVAQRRRGHRACALQGRRSRHHRSHQRTNSDRDPERHRANPRTASRRQGAHPRGHHAASARRRARHPDRGRAGLAGHDRAELHRPVRSGAHVARHHRAGGAGHARGDGRRGVPAQPDGVGIRAGACVHARTRPGASSRTRSPAGVRSSRRSV